MNEPAPTPRAPEEVRVWDPLVRIVHWGLLAAVATAWFSAEESEAVHAWAGYAVAVLVTSRIVWGVVGTREARFASFVRGPRAVLDYLRGLARGDSRRHLGHNPAGAAMTIALLAALLATTASGMALLAAEEGEGPLAPWLAATGASATPSPDHGQRWAAHEDDHEEGEELLEEVHELLANATLALILLHVLGVFASSLAHEENLARSMVTGRKRAE